MQTSANSGSLSKKRTFDVTHLSSSSLGSKRGVQLPPLMLKGQIRPDQVEDARFRVVESERRPLSDQQFNALIKRLVKCFMSEVEITKRLRKVTAHRAVHPVDLQLIRHLEALRRNYESERSVLVVKLSLDSRFNLYASHAAQARETQPSRSRKSRKSHPPDSPPRSDKIPQKTPSRKYENDVRARQRQSGGSLPKGPRKAIVCNHIVTPVQLSHRLREKLYRLQETSVSPPSPESTRTEEPYQDAALDSAQVSPSSSDIFYDIPDANEF
ncbi:uncharacterized protein LOC108032910 [Drosophila biarmipes]|uniref:uncharacterized protein LOC108032910 n=1 Tax=Drosophila biarmipes TaxID=125945 RepID=UPI0007E68474|nr:uncharacterized protein LOC108032910 [Drosophila biarmipes]